MKSYQQEAIAFTVLAAALMLLCWRAAPAQTGAATNEEEQLIHVLQAGASPREKDAACVRLKRIGTEQSIPALSALLGDEQLSHSARYALESMPSAKAGAVLIEALETTSGLTRIGIISSLGVRRESQAAPALAKLLAAERIPPGGTALRDEPTIIAAAGTLGEIATPAAVKALESALAQFSGDVRSAVVDGLLHCGNRLQASGDNAKALPIFQQIYENETSGPMRVAGYCGMIRASGEQGLSLLTKALSGEPGPSQIAALQLVRESELAGTTKALIKLLPRVSPPVQAALIDGLAQREDTRAAAAVAPLTRSGVPEVREASLRALGVLGDGSVVPLLAEAAASGSAEEQTTARQALVRLHHGNPTKALLAQLTKAQPAIRQEAARALGQRGDSAAVPELLELARQESGASRRVALEAVALLADERQMPALIQLVLDGKSETGQLEAAEALRSAFQQIQSRHRTLDISPLVEALTRRSAADRIALLPVCSSVIDPQLRVVLRATAADSDAHARAAAIRALCDTRDYELLPDLTKLACHAPEESFRALATAACVRLTTQEEAVKPGQADRIEPLKAILASGPTAAQKRMVLAGLSEIPAREALALGESMLDEASVQAEAARAVIKIAPAVPGAEEERSAALKKVLALTTDPDTRQAAAAALRTIQARTEFITTWQVAGPYRQAGKNYADLFDIPFPPEIATAERIPPGGATLRESNSAASSNSNSIDWRMLPAAADAARPGVMDLLKPLGGEQCVAYVRTRIHSKQAQAVRLEIGSDDGIKVWLNRKLVHAHNVARPLQPGSDKVDVSLDAGWNELLLKVTQNNLGWEFCVRLLQPDGSHPEGLQFAAGDAGQ